MQGLVLLVAGIMNGKGFLGNGRWMRWLFLQQTESPTSPQKYLLPLPLSWGDDTALAALLTPVLWEFYLHLRCYIELSCLSLRYQNVLTISYCCSVWIVNIFHCIALRGKMSAYVWNILISHWGVCHKLSACVWNIGGLWLLPCSPSGPYHRHQNCAILNKKCWSNIFPFWAAGLQCHEVKILTRWSRSLWVKMCSQWNYFEETLECNQLPQAAAH